MLCYFSNNLYICIVTEKLENVMSNLKKFVVKEIKQTLKEEKHKQRVNKLTKDLYEAVNVSSELKHNPSKYKIAKKVVKIAENRLFKEFHNEGEERMMKAQLLSIIENAKQIYHMMGDDEQYEDWLQYKVSIAENYLQAVYGYMKYFNGVDDMEEKDFEEEEFDDVEEDDDELSDEEIAAYFPDDYEEYPGDDVYYDEDFDDEEEDFDFFDSEDDEEEESYDDV